MATKIIRVLCFAIFLSGVPGLIISSIAGNNNGVVTTIGMCMAGAAIVLITMSATANNNRLDVFNDVAAERVEARVRSLVEAGANETEVRMLVRETIDFARGQQ